MDNVIYEELKIPEGKSPIWYCDIDYQITINRKKYDLTAEKVVAKGTYDEMKNSDRVKRSVLKVHYKGASGILKKMANFDLSKIEIKKITIRHFMNYGIKE